MTKGNPAACGGGVLPGYLGTTPDCNCIGVIPPFIPATIQGKAAFIVNFSNGVQQTILLPAGTPGPQGPTGATGAAGASGYVLLKNDPSEVQTSTLGNIAGVKSFTLAAGKLVNPGDALIITSRFYTPNPGLTTGSFQFPAAYLKINGNEVNSGGWGKATSGDSIIMTTVLTMLNATTLYYEGYEINSGTTGGIPNNLLPNTALFISGASGATPTVSCNNLSTATNSITMDVFNAAGGNPQGGTNAFVYAETFSVLLAKIST